MIFNLTHYTILEEIGHGGMAIVYCAHNNKIDRKVAVKVLKKEFVSNENIRKRFLEEARFLYDISHSNIIKVTDCIEEEDNVAYVMELIDGKTLKDYLQRKIKLNDDEIKSFTIQMLEALVYVHEKNIVHRDIKPSNFMLDNTGRIKLMDFGISKNIEISESELTQTGIVLGTPMYMSPEQLFGTEKITAQSDIYSLGVVLWQMVNGVMPYDKKTITDIQLKTDSNIEKIGKTKTIWDAVIQKAIAKDIKQRFKSAAEFKSEIVNIKGKKNRFPLVYSMAVLGLVFLISILVIFLKTVVKPDIKWVDIPGGTFSMGSPSLEADSSIVEIQHQVTLDPFKMSKYEVTFDQYDAFCDATGRIKPNDQGYGRGNLPVINVNWEDAKAFADWVGASLPTEAQWEYACRALSTSPFYSGSCLDSTQANFDGNHFYKGCSSNVFRKKTLPVGSLAANAWGLYDMSGNAWEWCADWYAPYPIGAQKNPSGPTNGLSHVCRGGSWSDPASNCRSACRRTDVSTNRYGNIGFRVVLPN